MLVSAESTGKVMEFDVLEAPVMERSSPNDTWLKAILVLSHLSVNVPLPCPVMR